MIRCYAAGRDGFWPDRFLGPYGVKNHGVDAVLVDAVTSFCPGQPPELAWINQGVSLASHPL